MATPPFYVNAGSLLTPGDLLGPLPYSSVPKPLKVARKMSRPLPKSVKLQGELREIFEVGKHSPTPDFHFEQPGEEILSRARVSRMIFLTWGSEVDKDRSKGKLYSRDWLIAPVFPLDQVKGGETDPHTGRTIDYTQAIRERKSPRYFPMPAPPDEEPLWFYVDFRRICPVAATYFDDAPRKWHFSPEAINDFYHHLIWFLTRRKIFFNPISCNRCGNAVDLGIVFEGQAIDPQDDLIQ